MRYILGIVCLVCICVQALAASSSGNLLIADFEQGVSGFDGAFVQETAGARSGKGAGRLRNLDAGGWVEGGKMLPSDLIHDIEELRFWVKSSNARTIAVRLRDATGQEFQHRLDFQPNGRWQQLKLRNFASAMEAWGGADDRQWHPPCRRIQFILEGGHNEVMIDDVEAVLSKQPIPELAARAQTLASARIIPLANFSRGTDGFDGAIQWQRVGRDDEPCIRLVNSQPSGWVEGGKDVPGIRGNVAEVRLWAMSNSASRVAVRLRDATGQEFQHRLDLEPNGQWQQLKISDLADAAESWGGAEDKQWHAPMSRIALILEGGNNEIRIAQLEAVVLDDGRAIPEFEIGSVTPGNVFVTGEPVVVPVATRGEQVAWEVIDFWGSQVGRGQTKVESGTAYVRPGVETRGYFTLRLASYTGEEKVGEGMTSFAIIAPADPKLLSNSPFGAMTHFAQGWDIDLLPLLAKAGIASVRDEHYWEHLERTKGVFEFPAVSDQYMSEVKRLGMDVMYAATFGNPHYTGTWDGAPATPEAREAYANYVLQVLDRYPELKTAEIWNEYNGSWCAGEASTDRPRYYAEMMKVVYPRIKAAHPDVQVGGCATVLIPMPYIEGIFKHGGLPYMDAVVIHPYRMQPEGVEVEIAELQELIRRYNDGRDKPIWVTETGAMPKQEEYEWERGSGMFEKARAHVARYLVRQYTLLHSTGTVERIYWYLARDYNEFKLMGLLRDAKDPAGRYAVASPYVAYANLIRQLHGTRPVGRASVESKFTYIMQFDRDGEQVRVCWATQPASVALQVSEPVAVVDMMGYERTLAPVAGHVYLTLSDSPVYVIGRVEKVIEGGAFRLAGQQTTDLLAPYGFNVEITDPAIRGAIRVLGKDLPVDGRGTRLTIDGVDTSQLRRDELSYVLMVNGRPAGMGQFQLSVVDPLSFSGASDFIAADTLRLILANESYRQGYQVAGLEWSLNDLGRTVAVETTIPERSEFELDLPVGEVQPYRSCVAECAVLFGGGRRPVRHRVDASYNPCIKRDVTLDGDETDWAQVPEMDVAQCFQARGEPMAGKVRIAWSERELHLFARVSAKASFQFAIAPDYRGKWIEADNLRGWYEIRVDANGAVTTIQSPSGERVSAKAVTKQVDDQVVHEISVPIADMLQLEPKADASFRLALLIEDGQRSAAWGSGIRDGHTPDGFRICRFVDGELPVHGERLVITPREMMQRARVNEVTPLADSVDDYSQTQGKNRWFYGYYAGDGKGQGDGQAPHRPYTDDDFRPMVHEQTIWGYTWKGDAPFNTQSADSMHPGRLDGRDVWAVRRWQSPITGTVRIAGRFIRGEQGDGIDGKILVDGVLVYSTPVGGPSHPGEVDFEVDVPVVTGSLVDIAVTPGGASNIDYDVTVVRAKISRVQ